MIVEADRPQGDYRVPLTQAYTLVCPVEAPVVDGITLWTSSEWELAWGDKTWETAEEATEFLNAILTNPHNGPARIAEFNIDNWRVAHIWTYSTNGSPVGHYVHTEGVTP